MGFSIGTKPYGGTRAESAIGTGCFLGRAITSSSCYGCYASGDAISSSIKHDEVIVTSNNLLALEISMTMGFGSFNYHL